MGKGDFLVPFRNLILYFQLASPSMERLDTLSLSRSRFSFFSFLLLERSVAFIPFKLSHWVWCDYGTEVSYDVEMLLYHVVYKVEVFVWWFLM